MQEKSKFYFENLSKYRKVLMGVQIILIIIFHFTEDCKIYDVRFPGIINLFYRYIRSSGVDMFLLLSGLGLYFSWKKKPEPKTFYKKRYMRILIPYFIVAVPAWIWLDIFWMDKGWGAFFKDISFISFFFEETRWFWYILMIGICYWIFPYIFAVVETAADRITEKMRVLMVCALSTLLLVMLQLYHNDLYTSVSIAVSRIPAFVIGVLLGKVVYEKREMPRKNIGIFLALAIIIAWPLQMAGKSMLGVYSNAFLNFAFSLLFVYILATISESKNRGIAKVHAFITSVLGWFGKYTLELYLIHVMVRKIMNTLGYHTYRLAFAGVMVIISIILSVALSRITDYIHGKLR